LQEGSGLDAPALAIQPIQWAGFNADPGVTVCPEAERAAFADCGVGVESGLEGFLDVVYDDVAGSLAEFEGH
jgi:hypothetical protein